MKKARIRNYNTKNNKTKVSEEYSLKQMLITIIVLLLVFLIFYIITSVVVKPKSNENTNNGITEIDTSKITVNSLLDRKESEYFVLATMDSLYDYSGMSNINYQTIYNNYIKDYNKLSDALQFYYIDLDDALNKQYVSSELNITDDISSLKLNNEVLFKIKDAKIESYYIGSSEIANALNNLKKS